MAELTILEGPSAGLRVPLEPDQAYTIGSGSRDSIQIHGAGVAERHLVIKALKQGGFGIKGLAGAARINGRDTEAARLSDGDRIELGDSVFTFTGMATPDGSATNAANAHDADPVPPTHQPQNEARDALADVPAEIGGFRLRSVLGKGGMGTVYRAEQVSLGREVALKVMRKDLTEDPTFIERFVAEARAAARLHHPNVVQVFDVDRAGETYFFSMELMHRGSLEDRLKRDGKLPVADSLRVIREAATGLAYAESLGIVHRDIKPDNLMIDQHDHIKIADLGLAAAGEDMDQSKLLGTPHFMSPEQIQRLQLDHRSDLYSLGCTWYRLLTGQAPFKRGSVKEILRAHLKDQPVAVHELDPTIPSEVGELVQRLLAKDPDQRFQSANELIERIAQIDAAPVAPAGSRGRLVIAGVAIVVAAAGALIWSTRGEPEQAPIDNTPTIVYQADPNAAATQKAAAESAAQAAYFKVQADGLDGVAKADALEAVAQDHKATEYGTRAGDEAAQLRAELQRERAANEARAAAIASAIEALRAEFLAGLEAGDFARADLALELGAVPAALRETNEVRTAASALAERLATVGAERLRALRDDVNAARSAKDPDALARAITALERVVTGQNAWPERALGDRALQERFVGDAQIELRALLRAARSAVETVAWQSLGELARERSEWLAAVQRFDFGAAAETLRTALAPHRDTDAARHGQGLVAALEAAAAFTSAFESAAASGSLRIPDASGTGELEVTRFVAGGAEAGVFVKESGGANRQRRIPLEELLPRLDAVFVLPDDPGRAVPRAAFLAFASIADGLRRTRAFLATIEPRDDQSGTGYAPKSDALFAPAITDGLSAAPEPWRASLGLEVEAARTVERALRALASRRNTDAAQLLERLLETHAGTLVVRSLE